MTSTAERIPQSKAKRVVFLGRAVADGFTPTAGLTIAITISKNGAAFGNPSGGATNATGIASGWYYVDLTTTDTGTLGPLIVRGTNASIVDVGEAFEIVNELNPRKNIALSAFPFVMVNNAGVPTAGLTVTAQRSIDGAAFASCANSAAAVSNGIYKIDLAAADLNGDVIVLRFTASGAAPTILTIVTNP